MLCARAVGPNSSLLIASSLSEGTGDQVPTRCLVDSGCTPTAFIDISFAQKHGFRLVDIPVPRTLRLADGSEAGKLRYGCVLRHQVGSISEELFMFAWKLDGGVDAILGLPWLRKHNPVVDWPAGTLRIEDDPLPTPPNSPPHSPPPVQPATPTATDASSDPGGCPLDGPDSDSDSDDQGGAPAAPSSPAPVTLIAGRRRPVRRRGPRRTRHADRSSASSGTESPELPELTEDSNIRLLSAANFLTTAKQPGTRVEVITLEQLRAVLDPVTTSAEGRPREDSPPDGPPVLDQQREDSPPAGPRKSARSPDERDTSVDSHPGEAPRPDRRQVPRSATAVDAEDEEGGSRGADTLAKDCPPPCAVPKPECEVDLEDLVRNTPNEVLRAILTQDHAGGVPVPDALRGFDDWISRAPWLGRVSDEDIEKYLKGKPPPTKAEILEKLPREYHDLWEVFEPSEAETLPPHRPFDHKIDLMPGTTPPTAITAPSPPRSSSSFGSTWTTTWRKASYVPAARRRRHPSSSPRSPEAVCAFASTTAASTT